MTPLKIVIAFILIALVAGCQSDEPKQASPAQVDPHYWTLIVQNEQGEAHVADRGMSRNDCVDSANVIASDIASNWTMVACERYKDGRWQEILFAKTYQ